MATLHFKNVNKIYNNNVQAVFDFNLDIEDKEFIVFVGPSGCGKSTTLRMIAGLEEISSGEIYIDDVLINDVPPKNRDIAMVFQNYALYPHMTVYDNMAFSLQIRKSLIPAFELSNPEGYKAKCLELDNEFNSKKTEGIKALKAKKASKEEINDFKYQNKNSLEMAKIEAKKEFVSRIYTYDHEKVQELEEQVLKIEKSDAPIKDKDNQVNQLRNEIETIKNTLDKPAFEYRTFTKEEIREKVNDAARILGLEPYLKRKPAAMSGGQRQRVALGRAIVRNPKVFLMDEPLSNLDAKLRVQMRSEISKIHKTVGATTVYVTHDQTEAMSMATRIVCMKDGYIQQTGTPKELFNKPANMFVAGFIGSPAMNFINGKFDGKSFISEDGGFFLELDKQYIEALKEYVDKEVVLGVRPEDIYFSDEQNNARLSKPFSLECDISELLGRELIIYSYIGEQKITVKTTSNDLLEAGVKKEYAMDLDRIHFFDKDSTVRIG